MILLTKQKQTHRLREGIYDCCAEGWGEGMVREFGGEWIHVYVWLILSAAHLKLSQYC